MNKKYTIGVDIGGTNTDAVIVDNQKNIVATMKTTTTDPISIGFEKAITSILEKNTIDPKQIESVFVGTTHATNALLQAKDLFNVGLIRITGKGSKSIPPCYGWPKFLKETILTDYVIVDGGFQCDGREITQLDTEKLALILQQFKEKNIESLAIIGTYCSINSQQEEITKKLAQTILGNNFPITLSHTIGGIGFIERENSTILNAALKKSMQKGFNALQSILEKLKIDSLLHLTQNNGTILSLKEALEYPILTISAGPTNSFVGAVKLTGLESAIVADIGGTSTDVGIVLDGFARRSIDNSSIADIKLNFPMPDVISIALGGGSHVNIVKDKIIIGPKSCGKNLKKEALCFGGNQLTLTDIAVSHNLITLSEANNIPKIQKSLQVITYIEQKLEKLKTKIGGTKKHLPIILVGGGALLFKNSSLANKVIIPNYAEVANAYGAALAEISGQIDTIISLDDRENILQNLIQQAIDKAINQGASKESIRIIEKEIIPFNYVPNNLARVKILVSGKKE